jgi:DNA-binding MarR family transcriptional regulator
MTTPNQQRVVRSVGSDEAELIGRQLMLDVLDEMNGQADHWVLVASAQRRIRIPGGQITPAIAAVMARGWLETDTTFHGVRRVRLTAEGRALFGNYARMHVVERSRIGPRGVRRRLPSRSLSV